MLTILNLKSITGLTLGIFIAVQLLLVGSVLLIPKPAEAWVFPNIEIGNVYDILKDIAAGILYSLAMNFIQKFVTKFINKLTEKYKIRSYLYYDQVLMNYYLTNYISDKISDPNLKKIYNLMNANFITGQSTGYQGQLDPRYALIPQLKKAISDEYIRSGGVPTETVFNPPSTMSSERYFSAAQQYFYNPPSFTEQNLRGDFGAFQSSATTAAQLEVIVGNGLKAGRFIGGTCKMSYEQEKLSPFAMLLDKFNIIKVAHADDPPPLPSTPLPGTGPGTTPPTLPSTPTTGTPIPPETSSTDENTGPEACKAAGGTWQASALDKARSFIDNPASFMDKYIQQGISSLMSNKFNPNKLSVVVGTLIGNILFDQFALDKTTGTLNEDPRGYNPGTSPTSTAKEIDIDGDGISDGVDIDGDLVPDICTYGGTDGGAGPPCTGSATAYNPNPTQPDATCADAPNSQACISPDKSGLVARVKTYLIDNGQSFSTYCDAFAIVKRVAWALRSEGVGLLVTPHTTQCNGFSADVIAYPDNSGVDILTSAGPPDNTNGPTWQPMPPSTEPSVHWTSAIEPEAPYDPTGNY